MRPRALALLLLFVAACGGSAQTTTTTAPATTTTTNADDTTTTTTAPTTTTSIVAVDLIALPVAGDEMGPGWVETLFLPYGDGEEQLGTSPGGEGGTLDFGPEYGAQAPDGTWWILDAAKLRLARYGTTGEFLGALALPEDVLVGGQYFQFQSPRVMADGTLVAFGFRSEGTAILRARVDGVIDQILISGTILPRTDDGTLAYGFGDGEALVTIDPVTGTVTAAEWFVGQGGNRFMLGITDEGLRVQLPDAGVDRTLPIVTAADPTIGAFGSLEVTTTADGRLHLLMLGASMADEFTQLGAYFTILPDGTVTAPVAVRNPFTAAATGSPGNLGAAYGSAEPWFMVVDTDGVHIYRRVG